MGVRRLRLASLAAVGGLLLWPFLDAVARSPESAGKAGAVMAKAGARFTPVTFTDLTGWADDDHAAALKTFRLSCPKLQAAGNNPKSKLAVTPALLAACEAAMRLSAQPSRAQARAFFEHHFRPHRVLHAASHGLFTGYYEPLIEGARQRGGRFRTAIHKRPADLVNGS